MHDFTVEAFELRVWRKLLGTSWREHKTNECVLQCVGQPQSLLNKIAVSQHGYFARLSRDDGDERTDSWKQRPRSSKNNMDRQHHDSGGEKAARSVHDDRFVFQVTRGRQAASWLVLSNASLNWMWITNACSFPLHDKQERGSLPALVVFQGPNIFTNYQTFFFLLQSIFLPYLCEARYLWRQLGVINKELQLLEKETQTWTMDDRI